MTGSIFSTIRYADGTAKALEEEKAYILNYSTPAKIPKSNFEIKFYPDIEIHNLRSANLDFQKNGITMARLNECMPRADFADEQKIESDYLPQVHECLCKTLGVEEVYIFDYMVRRREAAFPFQHKSKDNAPQPALSAHVDYTTDEIKGRVNKYFQHKSPEFGCRKFRIVNAWKPLKGPLRDYPMAFCDARSMNPESDLLTVDEVFPTVANEVYQVLYNPDHRWYYIPDQLDTELAIFAGYDSITHQDLAVPHCSFDLGEKSSGDPRESIEVRAFVFYPD